MNILLVGSLGKMATNIKEIASNFDVQIVAEIDRNFNNKIDNNFKKIYNKKSNSKDNKNLTNLASKSSNNHTPNFEAKEFNDTSNFEKQKLTQNQKKYCKNSFGNFDQIPLSLIEKIDVVLDFCSPQILNEEIEFCTLHKLPLVICSTGHSEEQKETIKNASKTIPIFLSANTSFLINLIGQFLKHSITYLKNFDTDIIETHHKTKLDSPSGTSKFFAQILSTLAPTIHSIRAGEIVGKHQIIFTSPYEKIVLSHTAFDRKLFAEGALKICKFLHKKTSPKLYTMDDIFDTYFLLAPQNGQV